VFTGGATIALLGYVESVAVSKDVAVKQNYHLDYNAEFYAYGFSNLVGSLCSSYPMFGTLSRTPINIQAGAKSQLAGVITSFICLISVLAMLGVIEQLPLPVVGATVIYSLARNLDFKLPFFLWKEFKLDFALWVISFLGVMFISASSGAMIMVGTSIVVSFKLNSGYSYLFESQEHSSEASLQKLENEVTRGNNEICFCKEPKCQKKAHVLMVSPIKNLYFLNYGNLKDTFLILKNLESDVDYNSPNTNGDETIEMKPQRRKPTISLPNNPSIAIRYVIINFKNVDYIDFTACKNIVELVTDFDRNRIDIRFINVKPHIKSKLEYCHLDQVFFEYNQNTLVQLLRKTGDPSRTISSKTFDS
jgi:MFS superfamily sulfate permease-like transporter